MLRGNQPATVDDKGRIKIPTTFRGAIRETYGVELFLTSLTGENVRAYPLPVWTALEERVNRIPAMNPARQKLLDRVNYFGHATTMDKQGRVLIPPLLRESAEIAGEVVVMGQMDYLVIWNHEIFRQRLSGEPLTTEDFQALADLGI
ncbi:MAG: division/cell wall cluster transcriptional repressor MraZ [Acidobacteriota bacterium]